MVSRFNRDVQVLVLATRNRHKTREFAELLGSEFEVSDLAGRNDLPLVQENGSTFEENAAIKAIAASTRISGLVVADDSGLEVDALGGAPGIYSARYAGEQSSDAANVAKLLGELRSFAAPRSAQFRCALALARSGQLVAQFMGAAEGEIAAAPRGMHGFGYDPVFVPAGFTQTFAELAAATKNRISHRAFAIAELREFLRTRADA